MTDDLRKQFSKCISYIYVQASYLPNKKMEFVKKEIEKYDPHTLLPMTREHAHRD
jgi:hypothetical protein